MDPNDSNIFPSRYIWLGLASVRKALEGLFHRQSALSPGDTESVLPLNSLASASPFVSAGTTSLAASVASPVTSDKMALLPIAISKNLVLPQTLLLCYFSYMDLKCLIFSRCVCSDWRRLVPLSDIHPTRRRFLEGCSPTHSSSNRVHGHCITSNPLTGVRTWRLSGSNAPGQRRISQRILKCTSSNGPLAWRLCACGQVFPLSTLQRPAYNDSVESTTSLFPHSSQLLCSNTNSRKHALSLHSLCGVIQSR